MAQETKCLTSGGVFHIRVGLFSIDIKVDIPFKLDLSKEEADTLSRLLHNQIELVLRSYWRR